MEHIDIASAIKSIRTGLGLTQDELAKKIGRKNRYCIADYETNRSRISAEDWLKIQALSENRGGQPKA